MTIGVVFTVEEECAIDLDHHVRVRVDDLADGLVGGIVGGRGDPGQDEATSTAADVTSDAAVLVASFLFLLCLPCAAVDDAREGCMSITHR